MPFTFFNNSSSTAFLPVRGLKNILFFKKLTAGIKKAVQAVCCTAFFSDACSIGRRATPRRQGCPQCGQGLTVTSVSGDRAAF